LILILTTSCKQSLRLQADAKDVKDTRQKDRQESRSLLILPMQLPSKPVAISISNMLTYNSSIIFAHGLTGNREKTWTHRNGIFWPATLLSEDFPHARIITFGYDADVVRFWTIASSNRLDNHGKSLAYALLDQRGQVGQRPIIFVAHGLGGLVCEEALNLSDKRQDLRLILINTLGIIFLGAPHGGSCALYNH
jgi:hypothetical protein